MHDSKWDFGDQSYFLVVGQIMTFIYIFVKLFLNFAEQQLHMFV